MASGSASRAQFHISCRAANLRAVLPETIGSPAAGPARSIFSPGILRAPALLLRGINAHGQRCNAQWVAPVRTIGGDLHGDAAHGQAVRQERSAAGTSAKIHIGRHSSSPARAARSPRICRSEEHTSELQSHVNLVCRLLLEKKKL